MRHTVQRLLAIGCLLGNRSLLAQERPTAEAEAAPTEAPIREVMVKGASSAQRAARSAHAVEVVDLTRAKQSAVDLGEVLARQSSLRVQREGGLGSMGRYSLNGLSGERVRFFLDGVPLELTAYQLGVGNVPVGLIDRVELFQGVAPVRFGADALGGVVNLVTDESVQQTRASASYEMASFSTHRLALSGRAYSDDLRGFARVNAFYDATANDFPIEAEVFDDSGAVSTDTVRRFHDGYRGAGVTVGAGLVQQGWVDRLVVQGYFADYQRDVQSNALMTVPYGEVTYARDAGGGNVSYRKRFAKRWRFDALLGYAQRSSHFRDLSHCRYDWYGRCFLMLELAGEIDSIPLDQYVDERAAYGRLDLTFNPLAQHMLTLSLTPRFVWRSGHDAAIPAEKYDALRAARSQNSAVLGLEYEVTQGRIAAAVFTKQYLQTAHSSELLPNGTTRSNQTNQLYFGAGDALRVNLLPGIHIKGAFEHTVRLPTSDERFGDGGLIADNLQLEPETSENVTLSAHAESSDSPLGSFHGQLIGSGRRVDSMIVLLNNGSYYQYTNVLDARALAADAGVGWKARGERLGVDGHVSYQDVRNTSSTGPGALFEGDRIPNLPYFQVSASAFVRFPRVIHERDWLELGWDVRHVGKFLRGWESAGVDGVKLEVPSQTLQGLALSHVSPGDAATLTNSFEVHNLTNEQAYDFYGAQRPGRSFHWKISLEYH
jgi:outer membrane receptor protein involved in Fe transport